MAHEGWEPCWRRSAPRIPVKRRFDWVLEGRRDKRVVIVGWLEVDRNNYHNGPNVPTYAIHRVWPSLSDGTQARSTTKPLPELTTFEEATDLLFAHFKETIALWEQTLL